MMKKRIWQKGIVIVLIQAFLCLDFSWAAQGELKSTPPALIPRVEWRMGTSPQRGASLSPAINLNNLQISFSTVYQLEKKLSQSAQSYVVEPEQGKFLCAFNPQAENLPPVLADKIHFALKLNDNFAIAILTKKEAGKLSPPKNEAINPWKVYAGCLKSAFADIGRHKSFGEWERLCQRTGVEKDIIRTVFKVLKEEYTASNRYYHNLEHIETMLKYLRELLKNEPGAADDVNAIEFAIWFHDVIYEAEREDNEERSAELAFYWCIQMGLGEEFSQRVKTLILLTKHTEVTEDKDGEVLLDLDLIVLGLSPALFDKYGKNIRKEYLFVREGDYVNGRKAILGRFLQREYIYNLKYFRDKYEAQARQNLKRAVKNLELAAFPKSGRKKIGVFVTKADPLTLAMEHLITKANSQEKFDEIIIYVVEEPLQTPVTGVSMEHRQNIAQLFARRLKEQNVQNVNIIKGGNNRFYDITREINNEYKNNDIYYLMGMRSFQEIMDWQIEDDQKKLGGLFNDYNNFIIADRSGRNINDFLEQYPDFRKYAASFKRIILDNKDDEITPADVRVAIARREPIRNMVVSEIEGYIKENKLYTFGDFIRNRITGLIEDYIKAMQESFRVKDGKGRLLDKVVEVVKNKLAGGGEVVVGSVGCGESIDLLTIDEEFVSHPAYPQLKLIGLDANAEMVDYAKKINPNISFNVFDLIENDIPELHGKFDVLIVQNMLHEIFNFYGRPHNDPSERVDVELGKRYVRQALEKLKKYLKPDGRLLIYDGLDISSDRAGQNIQIRFKNKDTQERFAIFAEEFIPKEIKYRNLDSAATIEISQADFLRFVCGYLYTKAPRWEAEKEESFQYFTREDFATVLTELGFTLNINSFTPQRQISRWSDDIELLSEGVVFPEIIFFAEAKLDAVQKKWPFGEEEAIFNMPAIAPDAYKGTRGKVMVVGGSEEYSGAVVLSANAAKHSGSGMVTIGVNSKLLEDVLREKMDEVIVKKLSRGGDFGADAAGIVLEGIRNGETDVLALGPGLKVTAQSRQMVFELIRNAGIPIVLDAGGLTAIEGEPSILREAKSPVVITPHLGEMSRLCKRPIEEIKQNREIISRSFAAAYNAIVVLKGDESNPTIITHPDGRIYRNTIGTKRMATAGMGDVLTGVIASLIGQGMEPFAAACLGVYGHSRAAVMVADESKEKPYSVIGSQVIEKLSVVFRELDDKRIEYKSRPDIKLFINVDKAKEVLQHYDIGEIRKVKPVEKRGHISHTAIIEAEKGKFVLKQSPWDIDGIVWERELIEMLKRADPAYPVPVALLDNEGAYAYLADDGTAYTLYPFIEGRNIALEKLTAEDKDSAAYWLAQLHALTFDSGKVTFKRKRKTDTIIEFNGEVDNKAERLERAYQRLMQKEAKKLTRGEKLFLENYGLINEQIARLGKNLPPDLYQRLPKAIIHGDFTPENLIYTAQGEPIILDWDTARIEARLYDVARSLLYDLFDNNNEFNLAWLSEWVKRYNQQAEKLGVPLSREEIRAIPQVLRARLIHQFLWLANIRTIELIDNDNKEYKIFEKVVAALQAIDRQDWEGFSAGVIKSYKWDAANSFPAWKEMKDTIADMNKTVSSEEEPRVVLLGERQEKPLRKKAAIKIGGFIPTGNPLHNSHLAVLAKSKEIGLINEAIALDETVFLLSTSHYEKGVTGMSLEDRFLLAKEIFEQEGKSLGADKLFVTNQALYRDMINGLREYYRTNYNQDIEVYFLVGVDSLQRTFDYEYPEGTIAHLDDLFKDGRFIVTDRAGQRFEDMPEWEQYPQYQPYIYSIPYKSAWGEELSSSKIREMVEKGEPVYGKVPDAVSTFIRETGVYQDEAEYGLRQMRLAIKNFDDIDKTMLEMAQSPEGGCDMAAIEVMQEKILNMADSLNIAENAKDKIKENILEELGLSNLTILKRLIANGNQAGLKTLINKWRMLLSESENFELIKQVVIGLGECGAFGPEQDLDYIVKNLGMMCFGPIADKDKRKELRQAISASIVTLARRVPRIKQRLLEMKESPISTQGGAIVKSALYSINKGLLLNVAHRGGASGEAPENTIAAFKKGIEKGAEALELDVQLSKDGIIIVRHDQKLEDGRSVSDVNFEGLNGLGIPSLKAVLEEARNSTKARLGWQIEIKQLEEKDAGIAEKLVALLTQEDLTDEVLITSFNPEYLTQITRINNKISTGLLVRQDMESGAAVAVAKELGATTLIFHIDIVTKEIVQKVKNAGLLTGAWGIKAGREKMNKAVSLGLDRMTTDQPDVLNNIITREPGQEIRLVAPEPQREEISLVETAI